MPLPNQNWLRVEKSSDKDGVGPSIAVDTYAGDKAYSRQEIRHLVRQHGTTPVIPQRRNEKRRFRFNRGLYRERNRVERLINQLKQYRRIATRYEKYAVNYLAMLILGAIRLWL